MRTRTILTFAAAAVAASLLPVSALADHTELAPFDGRDPRFDARPSSTATSVPAGAYGQSYGRDLGSPSRYGSPSYGASAGYGYGTSAGYGYGTSAGYGTSGRFGWGQASSYDVRPGNGYGYGHDFRRGPPTRERHWIPDRCEDVFVPAVTQEVVVPAITQQVFCPEITERVWVPERCDRVWVAAALIAGILRDGRFEDRVCAGHYETRVIRPAHWETRVIAPERWETRIITPAHYERRCVEAGHWDCR